MSKKVERDIVLPTHWDMEIRVLSPHTGLLADFETVTQPSYASLSTAPKLSHKLSDFEI